MCFSFLVLAIWVFIRTCEDLRGVALERGPEEVVGLENNKGYRSVLHQLEAPLKQNRILGLDRVPHLRTSRISSYLRAKRQLSVGWKEKRYLYALLLTR